MEVEKMALLIPILAVVLSLGIPLVVIVTRYRKKKAIFELYHRERMAAIEKGMEPPAIPESFLRDDDSPPGPFNPRRYLLKGLVWLFVGIGIMIAMIGMEGFHDKVWLLGSIPAGVGLAYLIYYFVEGRKEPVPPAQSMAPNPAAKQI